MDDDYLLRMAKDREEILEMQRQIERLNNPSADGGGGDYPEPSFNYDQDYDYDGAPPPLLLSPHHLSQTASMRVKWISLP
jgi:hypothetical protein